MVFIQRAHQGVARRCIQGAPKYIQYTKSIHAQYNSTEQYNANTNIMSNKTTRTASEHTTPTSTTQGDNNNDEPSLKKIIETSSSTPKQSSATLLDSYIQNVTQVLDMYQLNLSQQKRDVLALSGLNKKNTISLYRSKVRMFIKFCMLIGDAESTLIFLDNSPAKCPSANSRTVALFLRWKVFEKGTLLLDLDNTSTVKDVNGEDMKNVGDWNENNSINQFLSAVTTFHVQNDQSGGYLDVCSDCLREWSSNSSSIGCMQHAYKRKIIRGGNPRNSKEVKQMLGIVNKETENHVVRGAYQLIPREMRAIRKMLLSTNKIEDLQCWVMILISVKLYLRAEEVCTIRLDHFLKEWFVIDEVSNKVKALALKIKGKTDEDWLRFFIYRSDDCPEFCAMRHLLVYLHCCNIEGDSGWLFPNLRCRQNHVSYASFLRVMKTRFTHLLNRRLPLTCHSLRKTGYLFAIWGDARIEVIRIDARHTCLQTSLSYEQDAVSMLAYAQVQSDENTKFEVPPYKAVRRRCTPDQ